VRGRILLRAGERKVRPTARRLESRIRDCLEATYNKAICCGRAQ
jgi:hypothetical protein